MVVPRLDIAGVKSTLAKCIKYNLFVFQTNCMMFPKNIRLCNVETFEICQESNTYTSQCGAQLYDQNKATVVAGWVIVPPRKKGYTKMATITDLRYN